MTHANIDLLEAGYEAFASGDMATLSDLFADDVAWHATGKNPFAGTYEGKDEVFRYFANLLAAYDSFSQEIHDLLANDEHGTALVKVHMERDGKRLDGNAVHVFHFRDGKVTEFWNHQYDQYAVDALFE